MMNCLWKNLLPLLLCCGTLATYAADEAAAKTAAPIKPTATVAVETPKDVKAPVNKNGQNAVYDLVFSELSKFSHRVPGSANYYKSIDILEKILKDNGIDVKRQHYPTLVPEIIRNEFVLLDKEGKGTPVNIFPMAPNNAALISTGENPIEAEVIYIPKDQLYKHYGTIKDKIVLLDWGENYYPKIFFTEGTKAIIFVGNDAATQWDIAKLQSQYDIAFPYFYISKEEAEKHNLLNKNEKELPKAKLCLHAKWKQVDGINLWAEIKAEKLQKMNLSENEAIFLGARMDTFGSVPELVSGERQTANLALIAETAVAMSKEPDLKRSVFLILYGSSFNAYDGLRYFYYPVYRRNAKTTPTVSDYYAGFLEEQKDNNEKLKVLESPSPIIPSIQEVRKDDYIKWVVYGIASLFLAVTCVLAAIDIKEKKFSKRSIIAIISFVPALAIFVYMGWFFKTAAEQAQQDNTEKVQNLIAEINKMPNGPERFSKLNELDEAQKGKESERHYEVRMLIRDAVIKRYNEMNYETAEANTRLRRIREALISIVDKVPDIKSRLDKIEKLYADLEKIEKREIRQEDRTPEDELNEKTRLNERNSKRKDIDSAVEELLTVVKEKNPAEISSAEILLNELKEKWNHKIYLNIHKVYVANMRKYINERSIKKASDHVLLSRFADEVKNDLLKRQNELKIALQSASDWNDIAAATKSYLFTGTFYFDFVTDKAPFMFLTRTYEGVHYVSAMDGSLYNKFFEEFKRGIQETGLQDTETPYFPELIKEESKGVPNTLNSLSLVYLPHAVTLPLKVNSFTMRNIPGDLNVVSSNKNVMTYDFDEIPGHRNYELRGLIDPMQKLIRYLASNEKFSMSSQIGDVDTYDSLINYYYKDGSPYGQAFSKLSADGKEIDGPAAGMLALARTNEYDRILPMCGFANTAMGQINQIGYVSMPLLVKNNGATWYGGLQVGGAALGFDDYGHVNYINTREAYYKLFRAYGGAHVYAYAPLTSNFCGGLTLVNGFTDGQFKNFRTNARVATGDGYAYADREMKSKIYFFNETFILDDPMEEADANVIEEKKEEEDAAAWVGHGISIKPDDLLNLNVSRIAIDNTIRLNKGRIIRLHKRNIYNGVIEQYHDKAEQHMRAALQARKDGNINLARAHEVFGQTLAVQAYRPLRDMINDLVKSVLILLILTIPFAFALERLLIGSTNIYKQMAWVLIFFVATFLLLYFTHPAFALSQAPMIIFIAFFIIVMSVAVIYIVMNRFKSELLAMQGMDTSAHRVNSENSMVLAAIVIGVSSMRNRPVKTLLTILTVILLTFTIISFASFESTSYVRPVYMGDGSGEHRIESFLPQHVDLLMPICQSFKDLYNDNYHVFYRSASYNSPFYMGLAYPEQTNIIYNPAFQYSDEKVSGTDKDDSFHNNKTLTLEAVVGFEIDNSGAGIKPSDERFCSEKLKNLMPFPENIKEENKDFPGVYLSEKTAENMQLQPGDVFYLRNMRVRLDGTFKASELEQFTYLDNGKAVPPNFSKTAEAEEKGRFEIFNNAYVDASNFIWSDPNLSILTDYATANKINGFINAVILYPKEGKNTDIVKDATDIAEVTFGIVYSNTTNGVYRHFMAPVFSASGVSNLIVPLLLGALIILSSLLGSIADREREIFTFSALGLSPKDVSMLFFAESGVYAVIGGLGGYLLSQLTNAILRVLANHGLMEAPEMNFSSMTTVYTILIVMAIVLLSTIYPAIKAGRSASPDVARKWKMPPPDGDKLSFQFPFTVSRIDFGGILMFIGEHFGNHADSSLGSFAASNVNITHGKNEFTNGYMLSVDLTLAPFDLGVAEELKMYSGPSDIEGVDVVTVSILRKDGSTGAWLRGNRRFVDEVRNQFLLWRSLPVETVMHYRELAAAKLKIAAAEEGDKA